MTYARKLAKKHERNLKMIAEYKRLKPGEFACSIFRRHHITRQRFYKILRDHGITTKRGRKPIKPSA